LLYRRLDYMIRSLHSSEQSGGLTAPSLGRRGDWRRV